MGIIKQGILGGFSKKVGAVVGTSWKGIAVMKSMPQSVVNPRTTLQVNQRNAFRLTSKIASALLTPTIQECWNRWAKRESGYNAFIRANIEAGKMSAGSVAGFIYRATISDGELTLPSMATETSESGGATTFTLTWSTSLDNGRYDKATDIVKMGVIMAKVGDDGADLSTLKTEYATPAVRSDGTISITVTPPAEDYEVAIFAYVISADGYFRSQNLDIMNV